MRKLWILVFFAILLLTPNLFSRQASQSLTNSDIVGMVKAGLAPEVVIAKIKSSRSSFDTSPAALEQLKKAGVPDSVILAMVQAPERKVYVQCKFGRIGVHSDANLESSILGWADCHSELVPLGEAPGGWQKVRTEDGAAGYVLESMLTAENPAEAQRIQIPPQGASRQAGQTVYVSCGYGTVGINETADPNSRIVGKADCHTLLTAVGGDTGKWARVRTQDGAVGFVLRAFLTSEEPAAATAEQAELPANELRALAWRGVPWATTSYYQQPGSSYSNCTGQGQWLGSIYQSNLSCTGSYTPAQSIPLTWQHYTIYDLVETSSAYLVLACTRNWRWSKCSYLVPGDVFSFEYKKGQIWVSGERGGKGKEEALKYAIVLNRPKAAR